MKRNHNYNNADECYESNKQNIIYELKRSIINLQNELTHRKDLDDVILVSAYNNKTCQYEIINITNREYIENQITQIESQLADIDKIEWQAKRATYSFVKKLPHKDNSDHLPCIYYSADESKIRVPSLKRKTAWKRFYKMFPELKDKDHFCGRSTGGAKRASFIKLKKL